MPDATHAKKSLTLPKTAQRLLQSREPRAESREPRAESREPRARPNSQTPHSIRQTLPNGPARWPGWCDAMRRKHHRRYQGRFTRFPSRYRSLFAFALTYLALLLILTATQSAQAERAR